MRVLSCIVSIIAVCLVTGCIKNTSDTSRGMKVTSDTELKMLSPSQRYLINEPIGTQRSQTVPGRFNAQIIFLADQLERNVDRKSLENTFVVTTFSNLNKLGETTSFGRLVAESLIHELQVRKWQVFEVRLTKDIIINGAGEFSLSRDIAKLKDQYKIGGIVAGTYSVADGSIVVNSRVVDINTGIVTSSGQIFFPGNWFTDALLFNQEDLKPMRIVGGP